MKRKVTVFQYAINNVGGYKATKAVSHAICWIITERELQRKPTVEDYSISWKISLATAYRERAVFREAFPGLDSPTELLEAVSEGVNPRRLARISSPNVFGQLPFAGAA